MADQRKNRDPEARRREIVEAAAELILEEGISRLTHRRIAARAGVPLGSTTYYFSSLDELQEEAITLLGESIDDGIQEVSEELKSSSDPARTLARLFHTYLLDRDRMSRDTAFYIVSTENPKLAPVASRWFEGLVEVLSEYTDPATARAVALLSDGLSIHAVVSDEVIAEDEMFDLISRLWRPTDA